MVEGLLSLSNAPVFGHFANPWAWTYLVFIVSLFTWRQRQDEAQDEENYGAEKWAEYQAREKYRIFPGVYQEAPCVVHAEQHKDLITSPTPPSCRRFSILTRVVSESSQYCELSGCFSWWWSGEGGIG